MRQLQLISQSPSCSIAFLSSLAKSWFLPLFSLSFNFTQWFAEIAESTTRQVLFFPFFILFIYFFFFFFVLFLFFFWLLLGLVVWLRLGVQFVSQNQNFVCLILQYRSWFVQITLIRMVKFHFLAQFPVDHLPYPVVFSHILFARFCYIRLLCDWTFRLYHLHLLRLIYFCLNIVSSYGVICAAVRRDSISLLRFPFLSQRKFSRVRFCLFVAWNIFTVFLPIFLF